MTTPTEGSKTAPKKHANLFLRYVARFDDGEVVRWAFRGLVAGAIGVVLLDLRDLANETGWTDPVAPALASPSEPILPPAVDGDAPGEQGTDPRRNITTDEDALRAPMRFVLEAGGRLAATGSIDQGAAARMAAEFETRGEYIRTLVLDSPGGSLEDALSMSTLIRERKVETMVEAGGLCASSCPIVLAGGTVRSVDAEAAVGVHQFYAAGATLPGPEQAMADAQATTARISRHLSTMGVDPALWLHALDTPPRAMYYLSEEEMGRYRLTTAGASVAAASDRASR